jgi:hypothetical protein
VTPANPLVAGPVDMSTPLSGTFLLEDGEALAQAIESGDWVAGGMAAFAGALDTVAAVSDPLGSLIAAGLGWVMEHLEPLKGWMNDLTGDAGEVAGFAATWTNVGGQLRTSSAELSRVLADVEGMDGAAIQAYLAFQTETIKHLDAAGSWADAMATGLEIASTIVKIVHDIVRDAIAEVVGAVISYAAELVLTLGLATPLVIEQVSTRVASLVSRVGKSITRLMTSGDALKGLLKSLQELFAKAGRLFDGALKNEPAPPRPNGAPGSPHPAQTGGSHSRPRSPDDVDAWAREAYDDIRSSTTDVSDIAKNGVELPDGHRLSEAEVAQIKDHLFHNEHPLTDYENGGTVQSRFDADENQAEAWYRLQNGTATDTDRLLMQHELVESNYMIDHPGASYAEAHAAAQKVANWEEAIN